MTEASSELLGSNPHKRTFVYKRTLSGVQYCVKEQSYDSLNEANAALQESLAQCRVSHPYVCKVYATELQQTGRNEVKVTITLELMEEDMGEHIQGRERRNQPWPEPDLRKHALGLISALATAQGLEICHRDIKPENLLTNAKGSVIKICDFGCAKWIRELLPYHSIVGAPLYFSPQVSSAFAQYLTTGNPKCMHNPYKSDVYSLGVCLLKMAALKYQINTKGIKNVVALSRELSALSVSEEFKELLRTMLREDEESRPDFLQLQGIAEKLFAGHTWDNSSATSSEGLERLLPQSVARLDPTDDPELPIVQTFRLSEVEPSFDMTFERADSSSTYTQRSELPNDSIFQRALCIVCGQETSGLDTAVLQNQPLGVAEKATSVCSQACLASLLEKGQCLSCGKETEIQRAFYSLPCSSQHCFCKDECLIVFVAKQTDNFRKTPAVSCPVDHCEVSRADIYAALGGENAFHRLAFNIRLCVACKEIKSYYQLGCRQHWTCVKCFDELKKINFRCLDCEK